MNIISYLTIHSRSNVLCFLGKEYYETKQQPGEYQTRFKKEEIEKSHKKVINLYKNTVIHRNQDDEKDSFYYCINRYIYTDDDPYLKYPYNKRYTIVCITTYQRMTTDKTNTIIYATYPKRPSVIHENFIYPRY